MKISSKNLFLILFSLTFLAATTASATVYTFMDTWENNWNNDTQYDGNHGLGDEWGTPKLHSMNVSVENGYLTQVDIFLHISDGYQKFNSLFIDTNWNTADTSLNSWDFFIHDGEQQHTNWTLGDVPDNGLYTVKDNFEYTFVDQTKNRKGNPNGIDADFLRLINGNFTVNYDASYTQANTDVTAMLSYKFTDLDYLNGGMGLDISGGFYVAYAPWCANDVMGGGSEVPVPEPATMLLFGTGLAGIASAVRKKKKNA